jgi:hypothetical protein
MAGNRICEEFLNYGECSRVGCTFIHKAMNQSIHTSAPRELFTSVGSTGLNTGYNQHPQQNHTLYYSVADGIRGDNGRNIVNPGPSVSSPSYPRYNPQMMYQQPTPHSQQGMIHRQQDQLITTRYPYELCMYSNQEEGRTCIKPGCKFAHDEDQILTQWDSNFRWNSFVNRFCNFCNNKERISASQYPKQKMRFIRVFQDIQDQAWMLYQCTGCNTKRVYNFSSKENFESYFVTPNSDKAYYDRKKPMNSINNGNSLSSNGYYGTATRFQRQSPSQQNYQRNGTPRNFEANDRGRMNSSDPSPSPSGKRGRSRSRSVSRSRSPAPGPTGEVNGNENPNKRGKYDSASDEEDDK